jgi:hypothetical protein
MNAAFVSRASDVLLLAEKTRRARAIGVGSGVFYVPEVLAVDVARGRLESERINRLMPLGHMPGVSRGAAAVVFGNLGRALALVHSGLRLPDSMMRPVGEPWSGLENWTCLHGDLTLANACWDRAAKRLVIVDWMSARALGEGVTYGPRMLDVAWFCAHVFYGRPLRRQPFGYPERLATAFLVEYCRSSNLECTPREIGEAFDVMSASLPGIIAARVRSKQWQTRYVHGAVLKLRYSQWLEWSREGWAGVAPGHEPRRGTPRPGSPIR